MGSVQGHISLIQEERFRLVNETGQSFLFTLSHQARAGMPELWQFYRAHTRVAVDFEGEPDLASGVAHRVQAQAASKPTG